MHFIFSYNCLRRYNVLQLWMFIFNRLTDKNFYRLIPLVQRFKVTFLNVFFSNLSKYYERFSAWLK